MSYSDEIIEKVKAKNPNEPEFIQAVTEVMNSLRLVVDNDPKYQNEALLERIVEPERIIMFRVPWVDDEGKGSGQQRFPCTVQQCHRTLQGRSPFPSIR